MFNRKEQKMTQAHIVTRCTQIYATPVEDENMLSSLFFISLFYRNISI